MKNTRQIKFRVRNINLGKVIGYECIFPTDIKNTNFEWASSGNGNDWQPGIILGPGLQREQFTGLLDRNGKEVYEGDIVEVRIPEDYGGENEPDGKLQFLCRQEVKVSKNSGGYYTDEDTGEYCPGLGSDEIEVEIIGNIYENPDLLK